MRAGQIWVVAAVVALGAPAGCTSNEPTAPAKAASTPTAAPTSAFIEPGLRFSEDAEKAYLKALAKVDKKLAADADALDYGKNICLDIEQDKTDAQVAKNAAARFEVNDVTVKAIVKAAKSSLCKQ
ncbi:DUF732 domain-containing protein [Actinoplanes sp. NEAU-A12]|uniref:DUF732 domain-containing protein n=1 Tax=Actinoplanes sandaracinus TaxID=3045177 RepID=A0ABT6WNF1_9ACTN|nr:DUF732 domain-containing protein [Actinoplanes sandaracinus]MDI6101236.1 DUF732 domain-containing protein [Actinoplanes sandaracinus]